MPEGCREAQRRPQGLSLPLGRAGRKTSTPLVCRVGWMEANGKILQEGHNDGRVEQIWKAVGAEGGGRKEVGKGDVDGFPSVS